MEKVPSFQSCFPETDSSEGQFLTFGSSHSGRYEDGRVPQHNISSYGIPSYPSKPIAPGHALVPVLLSTLRKDPSSSQITNSQLLQVGEKLTTLPEGVKGDVANTCFSDPSQQALDHLNSPLAAVPHSISVSREIGNELTTYAPLHLAALKGDWKAACEFLDSHPEAVRARITRALETPLHIAAGARHSMFVEKLLEKMTATDLELRNRVGNTALCFAAASGVTKIAKLMIRKNFKLPHIRGSRGATPLYMAALIGHRDMVWYLYHETNCNFLTEGDRIGLLIAAITSNLFDVALEIIQTHPQIALARDGNGETALHVLARKPSAYRSGCQLGFLQRCIYSFPFIKKIRDQKLMHVQALELVDCAWKEVRTLNDSQIGALIREPSRLLFTAAELGIIEFLIMLIRAYPDLIWKVDSQSQSIFHIAVVHRQEKVFNLIHEIGAHKDLIASYKDENNNNMLHLAAKMAPSNRLNTDSGAALQLRRELHWFKEVEKVVQPLYRETRNSEGKTPWILFVEEHKGLLREGEKWMKDTAASCMLVATLIATVMFAAFFTVPGGDNGNTGTPIFLDKRFFVVFAISDALSFISSATSILMFLSILTSRYAEEDFLHSLPNRLIMGLATLFISIATMMVAFCATLFIVLGDGFHGVKVPIALVACIPVSLFALLQFPLFSDMVNHTHAFRKFFYRENRLLY